MVPDESVDSRGRYPGDRQQASDEREQLLDAREQRLSHRDAALTERHDELVERERLFAEREAVAERRGQVADEREAIADSREQHATARERVLDHRAITEDPGMPDPVGRIQEAFAREVSRLDRSDAFLYRSREAVERAQARLESLRAAAHRRRPLPGTAGEADDQGPPTAD